MITTITYNDSGCHLVDYGRKLYDGEIPIATTTTCRASLFTGIIDVENFKRKCAGLPILGIKQVKRRWLIFLFISNYTIADSYYQIENDRLRQFLMDKNWKSHESYARLGHSSFTEDDIKVKDIDYDPMDLIDSNFF